MRRRLRGLVGGAVILLALMSGAAPAGADPFEDGVAAANRGDFATAMRLWRPYADKGVARAQYNVGMLYAQGRGVPQDFAQARKWWELAAKQGLVEAQYNVGTLYYEGKGVAKNDREAVKWWERAAGKGLAEAQHNLGLQYWSGEGAPQDYARAHMWFNLAAASMTGEKKVKAAASRDAAATKMTPQQIETAQAMARRCQQSKFKDCGYQNPQ